MSKYERWDRTNVIVNEELEATLADRVNDLSEGRYGVECFTEDFSDKAGYHDRRYYVLVDTRTGTAYGRTDRTVAEGLSSMPNDTWLTRVIAKADLYFQ